MRPLQAPRDWQEMMGDTVRDTLSSGWPQRPFFWFLASEAPTSLREAWPGGDKTRFFHEKLQKHSGAEVATYDAILANW